MKTTNLLFTIILLFISILFSSCRKELDVPNKDFKKLYGTWEWTGSFGGIFPHNISPETEGYTKTIVFDKNGNYKSYKNGKKEEKHKFSFSYESTIYSSQKRHMIVYKNNKGDKIGLKQSFDFLGSNKLGLSDECYDCMSHTYVRK